MGSTYELNGNPAKFTEAAFQAAVLTVARNEGWRYTHSRPAVDRSGKWSTPISGDKGFPDLVMHHVAAPKLLIWELKTETGKVTADQEAWLESMSIHNSWLVDVGVYRPRDWARLSMILANPGNPISVVSGWARS